MKKKLFAIYLLGAICACVTLNSCETELTQQSLVDKVQEAAKKKCVDPSDYKYIDASIDTVLTNSPLIDPEARPDLLGAALYFNLYDNMRKESSNSTDYNDYKVIGELIDSMNVHLTPVFKRVDALNAKDPNPKQAGYFVCLDYNDGVSDKSNVWYYDIAKGELIDREWEGDAFGSMLCIIEEMPKLRELFETTSKDSKE